MVTLPLTDQNIAIVVQSLGVSEEMIKEKLQKTKEEYEKKQNLEFTLEFFNADAKWLERTKKK